MATVARQLWLEEGLRAFFLGATPRILRVSPAAAIMISSYEYFKNLFSALLRARAV